MLSVLFTDRFDGLFFFIFGTGHLVGTRSTPIVELTARPFLIDIWHVLILFAGVARAVWKFNDTA